MQWWRHRDCGSDGLWVLVDLGGHGMGCGLVFRWPNRCWYGDWAARLVVLVFGVWWAWDGLWIAGLLVVSAIGGFYNRYLLVVSPIGVVLGLVFIVIGGFGFFFFFFPFFVGGFCLGGVCVMVGWWWLLPCWVCVIVVVPVADSRGGCGAVDLFYWDILFYCIGDII